MHAALIAALAAHPQAPALHTVSPTARGYAGYRAWLDRLARLESAGAHLEQLGESVRGEPLLGVRFGRSQSGRCSLVLSGLHPMEWIGVETCFALMDRLNDAPPEDREVWCVPLANPDGIRRVEANLRHGRRRMVRHNARGVDLNRNFPRYWGRFSLARLLLGPLFARGAAAASEPEVRALAERFSQAALRDRGCRLDRALSLHSFGGVVLIPYGAFWRRTAHYAEQARAARDVAERIGEETGQGAYRVLQSARWVPGFTAPGMELDWFYAEHSALSLLVECSRKNQRLSAPSAWFEPFRWFNPTDPQQLAAALARALTPYVRGEA
ncbi:MAG: M14 family metallopeptidase [Polyangiaceae bacterium]